MLFILLIVCAAALPALANAASSGECGPALTWTLDDNGLMTISGTGPMDSFYALADHKDIIRLFIKEGVTTIGDFAFESCTNMKSVSLPNSLTSIGKEAFHKCASLESVTIPSSVTFLGTGAFRECKGLTRVVLPNSVTVIRDKTFYYCNHLTDITIPSTVTSIGLQAFGSCARLTSIVIPASVTTVDTSAFSVCASLKSVTVLNDATSFGSWVFSDCPSDMVIYCRAGSRAEQYAIDNDINVAYLDAKPTITTQPSSKKVNEGATATFKVVASNATGYQWYYQKPNDSTWYAVSNNGTSATYTLTTAARHNGYKYRVKVSNAAGSVWSKTVTLTVVAKPVITTQPTSKKVSEGTKATFKVVATGATAYQWYYQKPGNSTWTAVINNGISATYTLTTEARHNGYRYRVKVSNSAGYVWSNTVTLTVTTAAKPTITTQPSNQKVNEGAKATFKVVASNAKSYQWHYLKPNDSTWYAVSNNGTSATYTLTTAARHNGYKYRVKVSNTAGYVWSNTVTLTLNLKPVITAQPSNQSVTAGRTATFKVTATGATSYQWYYQKPGESTWIAVSNNGTSATYTLTTAARHNGYKYKCEVKNAVGSVFTAVVTLTVR